MGHTGPSFAEERELAHAWAALGPEQELFTQEGERLRVLFPGRPAAGPGPDFRAALLAAEAGPIRGDVELHLAASGWRQHGHASDRRYNRVVLHVVAIDDMGGPTRLASGLRVPVVLLPAPGNQSPHASSSVVEKRNGCCHGGITGEELQEALRAAGLARFRERAMRWRRVPLGGRDQALYQGVLEGLGMGGDRRPFRRLALLLPWARLQEAGAAAAMQTLLLAAAGLSPGAGGRGLRPGSWTGWSQRPWARAERRLLAAGALFARWLPSGPAHSLITSVSPLPEPARAPRLLRRWLAVGSVEAGLGPGPAPLGSGRADIIAVNVLLPLLNAWLDEPWAEAAYLAFPALERDGIIRGMESRAGIGSLRLRACEQQGLHHIFRRHCARGEGSACPLALR